MNEQRPTRGSQNRGLVGIMLGAVVIFGALFVAFLIYYTVAAPERTANPADVLDEEVPEEGVAVPDGGDLTGAPNQAAPDSPARTLEEAE